jgi:serine/threonine protein kinase
MVAKTTASMGAVVAGRYRIERFVDRGATSRVYLAEDLTTKEMVALKVFNPTIGGGAALMRARFLRGASAIMHIDHPHVIKVLDTGTTSAEGAPFVVLQMLAGAPLGQRLREEGRFDTPFALRLALEATMGLEAAHAAGVVHRDLKPDNLFLVRRPDGSETLKVIDFGLAKLVRSSASSSQGIVLGTIEYMAPEQIVCEEIDERTDIYGLGVVLYRMFTGHLPFDMPTPRDDHHGEGAERRGKDLLGHQLFSPVPPPSWLDEHLDPRIELVILCATRKRPENRYPTMTALRRDLERIRVGRNPRGHPLTTEPDIFEPASEVGRQTERYFTRELGFHKPRRP